MPRPESPFKLGGCQLKAIRELAISFDAVIQIPKMYALPTLLDVIISNPFSSTRYSIEEIPNMIP